MVNNGIHEHKAIFYNIHTITYISCDSDIFVYKLSKPLGIYRHIGISKHKNS
jgi:hypothetical protein